MNDPNKARRLPDETTVWTWLKRLNDFGPRLTGNAAHRESIDFIESELTAIGLKGRARPVAFRTVGGKSMRTRAARPRRVCHAGRAHILFPLFGDDAAGGSRRRARLLSLAALVVRRRRRENRGCQHHGSITAPFSAAACIPHSKPCAGHGGLRR